MGVAYSAGICRGYQRIRVRLEYAYYLQFQTVLRSLLHEFAVAAHVCPGAIVVLLVELGSGQHAELHTHQVVIAEGKVAGVKETQRIQRYV